MTEEERGLVNRVFKMRLRKLYKKSGCHSVTQFAEKLGINRQSVDRYFNGDRLPDMAYLYRICKVMDVSADWLIGLKEKGAMRMSGKDGEITSGVQKKLEEIFKDHCNLSNEEYENIRGRMITMIHDVINLEPDEMIFGELDDLGVILEFCLQTKKLTGEEYDALCNYAESLMDAKTAREEA